MLPRGGSWEETQGVGLSDESRGLSIGLGHEKNNSSGRVVPFGVVFDADRVAGFLLVDFDDAVEGDIGGAESGGEDSRDVEEDDFCDLRFVIHEGPKVVVRD